MLPSREVHHTDAIAWLREQGVLSGCSVVTSLPDWSELGALTLAQWRAWFTEAAALVLRATPDDGVAIFFQTDIKVEGCWIDKGFLCQQAALQTGHSLLWHKFACKVAPGNATYARPGFSHLLCFSKSVRAELAHSTADVLPATGDTTWARGMGVSACREAICFIEKATSTRTIVDPFCGHGSVLAVANALGLNAIGVELGGNRADKARRLELTAQGRFEFRSSHSSEIGLNAAKVPK